MKKENNIVMHGTIYQKQKKEDKPVQTLGEAIEKSNSRVRFQRNRDPDREIVEPSFSHLNKNFSVYKNPVATQRIVPTPEQEVIVNSDARRLKIVAFAGAGKTSTLIQYANKRSRGKGLYIAFNKDASVDNLKAEYWIAWRKTKPQNSGKISVPYAHWVEFGNSRVQASPFLRPAYDSKHVEAEAKVLEILHRAVDGTANHNSD